MSKFVDQGTDIGPKIYKKRFHRIKQAIFSKIQNKANGRIHNLTMVTTWK